MFKKYSWYNENKFVQQVKGAHIMKRWMRDMPLTMDEVRALMKKEDKQSKWVWLGVGISIVCSLIAIALWICNRRNRDMEHYFEYFDDEDFDDEDFEYDDEDLDDEDQEVEYVEIVEVDEEDDEQMELPK